MKKVIAALLLGIAFQSNAMAQKKKRYKEIQTTLISEIIHVSADSLWSILREFDQVSQWASTLHHSEGAGTSQFEGATCNARVCETHVKGFAKAVEELILFSDENRELAYELVEGAPDFLHLARNHWTVVEVGPNQSRVQMHITMRPSKLMGFLLGGKLKRTASRQVLIVLNDLKVYAETGEVSEAKKARMEAVRT